MKKGAQPMHMKQSAGTPKSIYGATSLKPSLKQSANLPMNQTKSVSRLLDHKDKQAVPMRSLSTLQVQSNSEEARGDNAKVYTAGQKINYIQNFRSPSQAQLVPAKDTTQKGTGSPLMTSQSFKSVGAPKSSVQYKVSSEHTGAASAAQDKKPIFKSLHHFKPKSIKIFENNAIKQKVMNSSNPNPQNQQFLSADKAKAQHASPQGENSPEKGYNERMVATEGNTQDVAVPLSSDYYRTTPQPIHQILQGSDFQSIDEKPQTTEPDQEKKQPASTGGSRPRGSTSSKLGTRDSAFTKKKSISTLNNSQKQKLAVLKQSIKPPTKKPAPAPHQSQLQAKDKNKQSTASLPSKHAMLKQSLISTDSGQARVTVNLQTEQQESLYTQLSDRHKRKSIHYSSVGRAPVQQKGLTRQPSYHSQGSQQVLKKMGGGNLHYLRIQNVARDAVSAQA